MEDLGPNIFLFPMILKLSKLKRNNPSDMTLQPIYEGKTRLNTWSRESLQTLPNPNPWRIHGTICIFTDPWMVDFYGKYR